MLNLIEHGTRTDQPSLLIAHGLYGSARNWGVIAKRLSDTRRVVTVDMRNHGASPWMDSHTYADMAFDLAEVLVAQDGPFDVLGHSMGGKAAMTLALQYPENVGRLIVADIAPVTYEHSQIRYVDALKSVDLTGLEKRSDAIDRMKDLIDDPALIPFFLQSLDVSAGRWRLNLDALGAAMPDIMGFPQIDAEFTHPTLFLSGGKSDYVQPEHRPEIKRLFPKARFVKLPEAGHWLHAEAPRAFEATVRTWLERTG
ncbi:alpha/beta fold hydrolase [Roseovarius pelagicus]|uniref:Alpha/beta fold hydrolase n=1 Tax=Roseovarius pelagicus TaxID=2980108 RepID=A0ABY6D9V4_9RHOB|nr:alpha/beta fold hydrolase [Roseovarius pelagicus]UXX82917.1 alpha/beta fold hydrolase [Roseovarius pelagicus]